MSGRTAPRRCESSGRSAGMSPRFEPASAWSPVSSITGFGLETSSRPRVRPGRGDVGTARKPWRLLAPRRHRCHAHAGARGVGARGCTHPRAKPLNEMSAGERRRVLIARALVTRPEALVLDEPTTGLDFVARYRFMESIRRLARDGTTLILVTHHVEEIVPGDQTGGPAARRASGVQRRARRRR